MISSYFKISIIFFLFSWSCCAQRTGVYWQPQLAVNYNAPSRWSFNFKFTNRNLVNNKLSGESGFKGDHLEFSHFTSYESGFYAKISLGLRYRNRDWLNPEKGNEVRITQQYSYAKPFNQVRIGHRARFEQRLYNNETVYRTRYRLEVETPLQGLNLNTNEFYAVLTTEALYSISTTIAPALDQRLTTGLGYQLSGLIKLQLSTEYRYENYLNKASNLLFGYTTILFDL